MKEDAHHEFTEFFLTEDEFFNLQFTNLPSNPEDSFGDDEFYRGLATRPLWYVVHELRSEMLRKDSKRPIEAAEVRNFSRFQSISQRYNQDDSELSRIFRELESAPGPWFERLVSIGETFEREKIDSRDNLILVRNLSDTETGGELKEGTTDKDELLPCIYHIVDGNHRLLVYALYISFARLEYDPVRAIHATSWQHSEHSIFFNNNGDKWIEWSSYDLDCNGMIHNPCRKNRCLITDEKKRQQFFEKIELPEKYRRSSAYFVSDRRDSTQDGYAMRHDSANIVDKWPF